MRALALKVKLYETSEALTKPVAEAADRGRRPATFQQKQEWMRECLFYMEKNQYWREEDQERGRVLVQRLLRREELSLLEWDGVVELLRRYRDDVGSVPD
jgi:tRNA C32,U32 (ribose-2'-O)-methylase TrmJ